MLGFLRSDSFWLDKASNSLNIDRTQSIQTVDRQIIIRQVDNNEILSNSIQDYTVDLTGETPYAKLEMSREYYLPDMQNYNSQITYELQNNILRVTSTIGDSTTNTSNASDINTFWTILDENSSGLKYNVNKDNFEKISLIHNNNNHTITANVRDDRLQEFFGQDNIDYSTINSTTMSIVLDSNLLLNKLTISYKSNIIDTPIQTTIDIAVQQSSRGEKLLVMDTSQVLLLIISILLLVTISFVAYKLYSQNSKK
ncbi:MAG: hypothetical protein FWF56_03355 [Firmicutes bacterium]|nr:hypothetical protein [Bacillota bacterium]